MPQININGTTIEAKAGQTIIEAALANGIEITHFCWHPELSVSGNCRMCLVEVGNPRKNPDGSLELEPNGEPKIYFMPKLQIACATPVSEGLHVRTNSEKTIAAQQAVMEFILINHPLDCPICDEAGQCKLQEYAFSVSSGESRFEEEKNHADKRIEWGPNVMFDAERCIKCSRCIRYAKEIAEQDVLTFVNRGDHVVINLYEGTQFDNPYSMNVIELCPVGALTARDFRFKARVWDMSFNDSICPGCSRGCNIKIGVRNNEVLRIEPKTNLFVNQYWLCDYGRLSYYKNLNENRVLEPSIKINAQQNPCSWKEALDHTASSLKKFKPEEILFIGSALVTNEDLFAFNKLIKQVIKSNNVAFPNYEDKNFADAKLKTSQKAPNVAAVHEFAIVNENSSNLKHYLERIQNSQIKAVYLLQDAQLLDLNYFENLELLIVHASNHSEITQKADVVIPASTFAEVEGTFTNCNSRVQHFLPALVTSENLRTMGMKMSRLDKFGAANDRWTRHEHRDCRPNWWIFSQIAKRFHSDWHFLKAEDVFSEITKIVPNFKDMTYSKLDERYGLVLGKANSPEPKQYNYESHKLKPN